MKKILKKILPFFPLLFSLYIEIMPYNVLIISAWQSGNGAILTQKEYMSYFDFSVFGRGTITAFPAAVFTSLAVIAGIVWIVCEKKGAAFAAFLMSAFAVLFAGATMIMMPYTTNYTLTGLLLLSAALFLPEFLETKNDQKGDKENEDTSDVQTGQDDTLV